MADFPLYDEFGDPVRDKNGKPVVVGDNDPIVSTGTGQGFLDEGGNWVQYGIEGVADELSFGDGLPHASEFEGLITEPKIFPIDDTTKSIDAVVQGIGLDENGFISAEGGVNLDDLDPFGGAGPEVEDIKATETSTSANNTKPLTITIDNGWYERNNPLHSLASYTYNLELYLLTYEDYNNFVNDPTFTIENSPGRLLIKSGGGNYSMRNPHFTTDFFIDDLEIDSVISPGGGNKGSVNTGVSFKITEPYGMTLLNSLVLAANHFGAYNYIEQPYLLKVKITGYDTEGKPVGNKWLGQRVRYIPIRLTDFKFGASEQGTTYDVTAIPYHSMGVQSTASTIPVDLQIEAKTVHDFFNVALSVNTGEMEQRGGGPPNSPLTPVKQLEKGLTGYLNKLEDDHVKAKLKGVPDIYAFEIDPDISKSKIVLQEVLDLSKTKNDSDPAKVAQQRFMENLNFDESTKTYSIRAGTSIINTVHSILRSCEYMVNQVVSANLKNVDSATEGYEEVEAKAIDFYRIVPKITLGPYDKIRNAYAKLITFVIKKYQMTGKDFENLGQKRVDLISKYYDYFYTGKNRDIISFDVEFNAAYFQTYTYNMLEKAGSFPTPLAQTKLDEALHEGQTAKTGNDPMAKWMPFTRQVVTQTATSNDINDPATSHKTIAIDNFMQNVFDQGADLVQVNMRIIGDMSYIQTKDMRHVLVQNTDGQYLADGSLNTDKEWHIHVNFRNPTDVNAKTGLMKGFNVNDDGETSVNTPSISGEYKIVKVTSNFSNGQFTQNLDMIRERNQSLNTLKGWEDKKVDERKETTDTTDSDTSTKLSSSVDSKGSRLTSDQQNALSSMNGYEPDDYEYTPDNYTTAEQRGNFVNKDVLETSGVEAVGSGDWNPKPGTVKTTPAINKDGSITTGRKEDFMNDSFEEAEIEFNEGVT